MSTSDTIAVASLKTHRLILTVPNNGPADIASNMQPVRVASVLRFIADSYDPPKPVLSEAERTFLAFALDLAFDQMCSRGDEFGDDDHTALATLRKLAGGEQA